MRCEVTRIWERCAKFGGASSPTMQYYRADRFKGIICFHVWMQFVKPNYYEDLFIC